MGQTHGEPAREGTKVQPTDEERGTRPPVPPFTKETAWQKVKMAQDAWNTRDPEKVALAYTEDSRWRNRDEFFEGREAIVEFLRRKWARELDYRLMKELWCFAGNRISVRFEYESHDASGQWWRSHHCHRTATKLSIVAATGREPEVTLAVA
jgi:nuclear transport factor 2 (NTF2) superfamily protein